MAAHTWNPSSMERTCLSHLDREGSWEWLRAEAPEKSDRIGWRHVRRVFPFNFLLFAVILIVLFTGMAVGSGYRLSDLREDAPIGLIGTAFIAAAMSLYVTNLYRKAWNRRARFLSSDD